MANVPPFDPAIGIMDPNFSAGIPNYLNQFQHRMAVAFRHPYVLGSQPLLHQNPVGLNQTVQLNASFNVLILRIQFIFLKGASGNVISVGGTISKATTVTPATAAAADSSRPDSAASSLTSNIPPQTPTAMLSPNGLVAIPMISAFPGSDMSTGIIPGMTVPPTALLAQFPGGIFPQAAFVAMDPNNLKECVRNQM